MPMEDIDQEVSKKALSEDDELLMREVFQDDADLFYLHHYLSDIFRREEI